MYNRPVCNKTRGHARLYRLNRLGIMRQVHYSEKDKGRPNRLAIDMVIFLNGLPIITIELKNELTGQHHHNAIKQYMMDRQVKGEKLLEFKRCLVHFAVGTEQVFMTTKLDGTNTYFMPYNKTYANIGVESDGYRTDYLWKDVLRRDSIIDLVSYYVNVHKDVKKVYNSKTGQAGEQGEHKTDIPTLAPAQSSQETRGRREEERCRTLLPHSALGRFRARAIPSHGWRSAWSSLYRRFNDEKKLLRQLSS